MPIALSINKDSKPNHETISQAIAQVHNSGKASAQFGVLIDIPRKLWKKKYQKQKLQPVFVDRDDFWVGHVFIPAEDREMLPDMLQAIMEELQFRRLKVCTSELVKFEFDHMPNFPLKDLPALLQISGIDESGRGGNFDNRLYDIQIRLEKMLAIEFISFSTHHVIYKLPLMAFADLKDPDCESSMALAYSGDLDHNFINWQPFSNMVVLGEIKNLESIEYESSLLNIKFPEGSSPAHKLNRLLQGLTQNFPVSLPEAQEMLSPKPDSKFEKLSSYYEKTMPFSSDSQCSIVAWDPECVIAISSSKHPLYIEETNTQWLISDKSSSGSKTIPGKVAFVIKDRKFSIKSNDELSQWVFDRSIQHHDLNKLSESFVNVQNLDFKSIDQTLKQPLQLSKPYPKESTGILKVSELEKLPPVLLGKRPLLQPDDHPEKTLALPFPVLSELKPQNSKSLAEYRKLTQSNGLLLLEDLIGFFMSQSLSTISFMHTTYQASQDIHQVLKDLGEDAVKTVQAGCRIIIIDDSSSFEKDVKSIPVPQALTAVQNALIAFVGKIDQSLRRSCSIVVRTKEIKSLDDIQKYLSLGANSVVPYTLEII